MMKKAFISKFYNFMFNLNILIDKHLLAGLRFYIIIVACCILGWIVLFIDYPHCQFNSDTVGYFYPVNIFLGRISPTRPPVYCLFLNMIRLFGDQNLKQVVISIQFACMLSCIVLFARIMKALFIYKFPIIICCGFIAWQSYYYCISLFPECFSFCIILIVIYFYRRYSITHTKKYIWIINLSIAIGILTKPIFVVLAIALFLAWSFFIATESERKNNIYHIIFSFIVSILLVLSYCSLVNFRYGSFTVSTISLQNDLLDIIKSNVWKSCDDSLVKTLLEEELEKHKGGGYGPYPGAFAVQWAAYTNNHDTEQIDTYNICPKFLFESENVCDVVTLKSEYKKGKLYPLSSLKDFVNQAKSKRIYKKYKIIKIIFGIFPPSGVLLIPFWLSFVCLIISFFKKSHIYFLANLLYLGFIATVILKSDMQQNNRLLYPVFMIPWMNFLFIIYYALQKDYK